MMRCSLFPNSLEVTSTTKDCVMEGSQHVTQLGLHDRYNLDVRIVLSWTDKSSGPTMMDTDGNIMVEVGGLDSRDISPCTPYSIPYVFACCVEFGKGRKMLA